MNPQKQLSLQSIHKRRQQGEFVGREEQLTLFRQNLAFDLEDDRRRFAFSVSGQGGVGKSTLLGYFSKLAEDVHAITAWVDETDEDVPTIMAHLAEQLGRQEHAFKTFDGRYHLYRQRRQELESDPEVPQTSLAFISHILTKVGVRLGRRIPIGGAVLDLVDENALASQVSEWSTFVARKLTNKDEVHLLQEPTEVLTPLFLEGLWKVAEKHLVALFFDTYERTGEYLDNWLRKLLEGLYGIMPSNIVLTIAGRNQLDKNRWVKYEGLLARITLEPFTEQEAREYLARKGIVEQSIVEIILLRSGCFPLLLATLASESPSDSNQVGDPSGTAVECFLKWEDDSKRRQMIVDAALPRVLNQDVLAELVGEKNADTLFFWLRQKPFMEHRGNGWIYHDTVRSQILRYKLRQSPQGWATLHGQLADYYEKRRDSLGLNEKQGQHNATWQDLTIEVLYHHLCQTSHKMWKAALNSFLTDFGSQYPLQDTLLRRWVETVFQASTDSEATDQFDKDVERHDEEMLQIKEEFAQSQEQSQEQLQWFNEELEKYRKQLERLETLLNQHKKIDAKAGEISAEEQKRIVERKRQVSERAKQIISELEQLEKQKQAFDGQTKISIEKMKQFFKRTSDYDIY